MFIRFPCALRAPEDGGSGGLPAPAEAAVPDGPAASAAAEAAAAPPADPPPPTTEGDTAPADGADTPTPLTAADISVPEGMAVDTAALEQFLPVAAELGLSREQAQKLVDLHAGAIKAQQEAATRTAAEWVQSSKGDKEFGGAGFATNLAIAERGLAKFGTPDLRALLDQTGLGNHPEIVRAFYRAGLTVTEPGPVSGLSPSDASGAISTEEFYRDVFSKGQ